ncbi:MAG: ATP synthase F0 subunit B, partial [Defluviitaleaceae bacterium]|nr:ATP synthase F0 subunit B [Defluviitaleaceae bacterium]
MRADFLFILSGELSEGRVFGLDTQTVMSSIAAIFSLIVLAIILTLLLYKPVKNFMQRRTDEITAQFDRVKADTEKAAELKLEYEDIMAGVEVERAELLEAARQTAREVAKQIESDAKKTADEMMTRARTAIIHERERAEEQMRLQIIGVSAAMTERFLARSFDEADHIKMYDETLAEL